MGDYKPRSWASAIESAYDIRPTDLDVFIARNSVRLVEVMRGLKDGLVVVAATRPRLRWVDGLSKDEGLAAMRAIVRLTEPPPTPTAVGVGKQTGYNSWAK